MNKNKGFCSNKQAFNLALEKKHHKIIKLFIENNNNDLSELIQDPLMILQNACFYCDLRMVKLLFSIELLAKKTEEKSVQSNLLCHACANENKEIIDFLKEKGFEISDDENINESKFRNKHEYKKNPLLDKNELALIFIIIKRIKLLEARTPADYTNIHAEEIEKYSVNLDDYELSFTDIYNNTNHDLYFNATRKSNKEKITVQLVKYDQFPQTVKELSILKKMNHPVIVKFIGISSIPLFNWKIFKQITLSFTEYYVPNGTLKNHMINERNGMADPKFDLTKKYIILLGISHLMKYLHKNGIIYENLNPEIIILDENLYPKISDFKFANINNQPLKYSNLFRNEMRYSNTRIAYFAPELLNNRKFGSGVDVFAFGMIAYELVSLKVPFEKANFKSFFFCEQIDRGYRPAFNNDTPVELRKMISECWANDPEDRPSFDNVFEFLVNYLPKCNEIIDKEVVLDYIDDLRKSETKETNCMIC